MVWTPPCFGGLRERAGEALLHRVAGPTAHEKRARIHETPGPRWFGPDRPVRLVHPDAAMYVGGLAALLLQSLHPVAMAAVAAHSGFESDPWGRLQRTSTFLATTTFGTAQDAERAVLRVRRVHDSVRGRTPEGVPYRASDPHLLAWVHAAETACFLRAHQRYGRRPLDPVEADGYVADMAQVARRLGVVDPPENTRELAARLARYRPELRATAQSRAAARYLLSRPPLPWPARLPYAFLAAAAVELLPAWVRARLDLPYATRLLLPLARPGGHAVVAAIRWIMPAAPRRTRAPAAGSRRHQSSPSGPSG
ncbi:oxygenase MpaB family protein [Streptomyces sp. NK15101]|uniref:oxygenase MpaB family protein n=1 Tax=Streptomyces sp. NK15101 TaxID=2873261 RepID=UPI001CECF435|nr:oxygenase MpaB family protein [Streptomyces sp. NK15101]